MKAKRRLLIAGIVVGSLLSLAPLFGMLGTVYGMIRAFNVLGNAGVADPRALAGHIATTLDSTAAGLFLFPFGVVILTLSIVFFARLRESTPPPLPQADATITAELPKN